MNFFNDERDLLSHMDKAKLPYSLLLDPVMSRAAAYTNNHRLITAVAANRCLTTMGRSCRQ